MLVLVINCGSSSIRAALIESHKQNRIFDVHVRGVGDPHGEISVGGSCESVSVSSYTEGLGLVLNSLGKNLDNLADIKAVGHRVVHGGEALVSPIIVTDDVEAIIESLLPLAPLHNATSLAVIRAARGALACPHIAVFDTAFHATLPDHAKLYALSGDLTSQYGIRRFGFHGISHEFVSQAAASELGKDPSRLRIISCHLGSGCSVTAVENGRSVETSMGMTPLEGLVMGSRCGDVDAGALTYLMRNSGMTATELDAELNHRSGLLGMTGTNNMQEVERRAEEGDESCQRAIEVFAHRARKYIGAYAAVMGGVDAIVFTGGVGEHSALIRYRIAQKFDYLGATLDADRNRNVQPGIRGGAEISSTTSRVKILVIASDEEVAIANAVEKLLKQSA